MYVVTFRLMRVLIAFQRLTCIIPQAKYVVLAPPLLHIPPTRQNSPAYYRSKPYSREAIASYYICSRVVRVRETRLTGIISHVMIGLSMFLLPYPLSYIPAPVLDGLFLYVAITALFGNQLFDRILLFFTEQVGTHIFIAISAYTKKNEPTTNVSIS